MPDPDSNMKSRFAAFQDRLDALMAARHSLWESERLAGRQEESRNSEAKKWIRDNAHLQAEGIQRELRALYQEALGKVGLEPGDIVRFHLNYGDAIAGEYGVAERFSRDNDHHIDMVSLELMMGVMSVDVSVIQPVLDPDEANIFRFRMAARYMEYHRGADLRKQLDALKDLLNNWVVEGGDRDE